MGFKRQAVQKAGVALDEVRAAQQELESAAKQIKHLRKIVQALWQIMKTRLELEDSELLEMVEQVSQQEKTPPTAEETCPHCQRFLQANRSICLYCGNEVERPAVVQF